MKKLIATAAALPVLVMTSGAALAQATPSAAETGVTEGFQAIVDLAVPLMIGIAAVVVAATWGLRMLKKA
jgi:hypothetical protein